MTMPEPEQVTTALMVAVFPDAAKSDFISLYPEKAGKICHALEKHDLLTLSSLANMAAKLPPESVEYNKADLPIGIDADAVPDNGLSIAETILSISENGSWAVLKNIEQDRAYAALLHDLLAELNGAIQPATGEMLTLQGYIFISSPNAVTPFHFDPEHNILLQLKGQKAMHVWPAGDTRFAADACHENYHAGGHRNLPWDDSYVDHGQTFNLAPGEAIYVPVMAPHWVKNGPEPSISLSLTWRSAWSYREGEARAANRYLRRFGIEPKAPPRWPQTAQLKTLSWRAARRLGFVR